MAKAKQKATEMDVTPAERKAREQEEKDAATARAKETPTERRDREKTEMGATRAAGRPVAMINTGDGPVTARAPNSPVSQNPAGTPNKNNPTQKNAGLVDPADQDNTLEQIGNTE